MLCIVERKSVVTPCFLGLKSDFESRCHGSPGEKSGPLIGRNLSEVVNKIVWVRQLIHRVNEHMFLCASNPFCKL